MYFSCFWTLDEQNLSADVSVSQRPPWLAGDCHLTVSRNVLPVCDSEPVSFAHKSTSHIGLKAIRKTSSRLIYLSVETLSLPIVWIGFFASWGLCARSLIASVWATSEDGLELGVDWII